MTSVSGINPALSNTNDHSNSGYAGMQHMFGGDLKAAVKDEFVSSAGKKATIGSLLSASGLLLMTHTQGHLKTLSAVLAAIGGAIGLNGGYEFLQGKKVEKGLAGVNYNSGVLENLEVYSSPKETDTKLKQSAQVAEALKSQGLDYYQFTNQQEQEKAINTGALQVLGQAGKTLFEGNPHKTEPKSTLPSSKLTISETPYCGC